MANKDTNKYSLLLINGINGDSDMITEHKTDQEVRAMVSDPKYRAYTIVGFPTNATADANGSTRTTFKEPNLTRSEKLSKIMKMLKNK